MNLKYKGLSLLLVSGFFAASTSAYAFPRAPRVSLQSFRIGAGQTGVNFEGIVALDDCSGSIVRYESSRDDDQAMVLTNGHCNENGMPDPGTFTLNVPSNREFVVLSAEGAKALGTISAEKILYSTMTKTDITMYRLKLTYRDIFTKFAVHPLTLSSKLGDPGSNIEVISGYWKRGYACSIEYYVDTLKEAGWTMRNSIRYSRPGCEIIGGTSGSPIVMAGSRTMIGINNTVNENGETCTMDNPCEVSRDGTVTATKGVGYGQQTALIYSCLDSQLRLDLSLSTCRLPGGPQAGAPNLRKRR
jgi:hypothetical protein